MSESKENLRTAIQIRRIARGKSALDITQETIPVQKEKLSQHEEEKRRLRRERNKLAANKCRKRKREKIEYLEKTANELIASNQTLELDIATMRQELKELTSFLTEHQCKLTADTNH